MSGIDYGSYKLYYDEKINKIILDFFVDKNYLQLDYSLTFDIPQFLHFLQFLQNQVSEHPDVFRGYPGKKAGFEIKFS